HGRRPERRAGQRHHLQGPVPAGPQRPQLEIPLPRRGLLVCQPGREGRDGLHGRQAQVQAQRQDGRPLPRQELLRRDLGDHDPRPRRQGIPRHRARPDWLLQEQQARRLPVQRQAARLQHARPARRRRRRQRHRHRPLVRRHADDDLWPAVPGDRRRARHRQRHRPRGLRPEGRPLHPHRPVAHLRGRLDLRVHPRLRAARLLPRRVEGSLRRLGPHARQRLQRLPARCLCALPGQDCRPRPDPARGPLLQGHQGPHPAPHRRERHHRHRRPVVAARRRRQARPLRPPRPPDRRRAPQRTPQHVPRRGPLAPDFGARGVPQGSAGLAVGL
ncbi:hypothetical protein BN1708_018513, partial [Verticillium longisporum]